MRLYNKPGDNRTFLELSREEFSANYKSGQRFNITPDGNEFPRQIMINRLEMGKQDSYCHIYPPNQPLETATGYDLFLPENDVNKVLKGQPLTFYELAEPGHTNPNLKGIELKVV